MANAPVNPHVGAEDEDIAPHLGAGLAEGGEDAA